VTPREVLIEARRLIAEKGWTQDAYARDAKGRNSLTEGFDGDPVCFCADGAIRWATHMHQGREEARCLLNKAIGNERVFSGYDAWKWNDTPGRTKEEVLSAFDRAIALAEAQS
jgi:hypothetical protein